MTTSVKPDLTEPFKNFEPGFVCVGPAGYLEIIGDPYEGGGGTWYVPCRVLETHKPDWYHNGEEAGFDVHCLFVFDEKYGPNQYVPQDIELHCFTGGFSNAIFLQFRVYTQDVQDETQKWWLHCLLWDYHQSEPVHMIYDHKNRKWNIVSFHNWKNYFGRDDNGNLLAT